MSTFVRSMVRLVVIGAAALALLVSPAALVTVTAPPASAQPCYNGVLPWGPFVPSCTVPGPTAPRVRGAAPDANAIIACRNHPGCLSWYVNGGP
ncbi:hypothetical protein [Mycobacterium sp. OAE908]|uniref:hypothetical protein n=1 Tax=Mycobacterium sp. OAE908 TaxID=2817899 RepID=UPI001AE63C8B